MAKIKFEVERWLLDEFSLRCREKHVDLDQAIIDLIDTQIERYRELEKLR